MWNSGDECRGPLDALLAPRVIAVVGASRNRAKWSRRVLEYTHRAGFTGALYAVNPAVCDLDLPGVTTVRQLQDITEPVDLAVVARPAIAVPDTIAECASLGVRAAVVTAAGFSELGDEGVAPEHRVQSIAAKAGIRLLGPNTFGLSVAEQRINLTPREHIPPGSIALLTQSGNVAVALYEQAERRGIGFSACVGVGNQCDIDFGDLLAHFAADACTRAVGIYLEGLRGGADRFRSGLAACKAAGKPVVALKAGRSAESALVVATHTGALASDDRVWQAVLADAEVISVTSTQDLIDALAVLNSVPPHGGRVVVLTDGGGDSVMAADALADAGLTLAAPSMATREMLDKLTPPAAPRVARRNPITLDTAGGVEDDPMLLARCAAVAAADEATDVLMVAGLIGGYPNIRDREMACVDELIAIRERTGVPVVVQSAFADAGTAPVEALKRTGIVVLPTVNRLARALALRAAQPDRPAVSATAAVQRPTMLLPVTEVADLLSQHEITVPPMHVVAHPAELKKATARVAYPACIKLADPAIHHKSDVDGVRLGLANAAEVCRAATELWERFPDSPLLVMPSFPPGQELVIGTGCDPVFGPFVLVGRGGIWAETDPDVALRLAPINRDLALRALQSLRCAPILTGGRGSARLHLEALADLLAAMSRVAADRPDVSVEINPVIAYPRGYALADLRGQQPQPRKATSLNGL
jgi:acetyltransferase